MVPFSPSRSSPFFVHMYSTSRVLSTSHTKSISPPRSVTTFAGEFFLILGFWPQSMISSLLPLMKNLACDSFLSNNDTVIFSLKILLIILFKDRSASFILMALGWFSMSYISSRLSKKKSTQSRIPEHCVKFFFCVKKSRNPRASFNMSLQDVAPEVLSWASLRNCLISL